MHHGQSRGERSTHKVCNKQVNFSKTGKEIFESREEIIIVAKQGGNELKEGK